MSTAAAEALADFERIAQAAHRFVYTKGPRELADYLRHHLGRQTVAYITDTADVNTVTRWANGTAKPERSRTQKMRVAAEVHYILTTLFGSDESAADWFTGKSSVLTEMPADLIRKNEIDRIFDTVRSVAEVIKA